MMLEEVCDISQWSVVREEDKGKWWAPKAIKQVRKAPCSLKTSCINPNNVQRTRICCYTISMESTCS